MRKSRGAAGGEEAASDRAISTLVVEQHVSQNPNDKQEVKPTLANLDAVAPRATAKSQNGRESEQIS